MSPELETLDQLLCGEMPLALIRRAYAGDDAAFARSIHSLLRNGDVRLLADDRSEVPEWRWRELFVEGAIAHELPQFTIAATEQGIRRMS